MNSDIESAGLDDGDQNFLFSMYTFVSILFSKISKRVDLKLYVDCGYMLSGYPLSCKSKAKNKFI